MARNATRREIEAQEYVDEQQRRLEALDRALGDGWLDEPPRAKPIEHAIEVIPFVGNYRTYAFKCTGCFAFGTHRSTEAAARADGDRHLAKEHSK